MKNRNLIKSLTLLAHPFSLSMMALLLVNDHLLRRYWPSWWTGKLGDVAWLGFFPFAVASILSLVPLLRRTNNQRWVGWLAFGGTAVVFILAKTLPLVHQWVFTIYTRLIGAPPLLVRDPTDLLALPVLLVGWRLWQTVFATDSSPGVKHLSNRPAVGMVAFPLAALLTLANSAAPDYGITCLYQEGSLIYAGAAYAQFQSSDGGMTWQPAQSYNIDQCRDSYSLPAAYQWQEYSPLEGSITYRYHSGEPIQASSDSGQTWHTIHIPELASPAVTAYMVKTRSGNPEYTPGPFDALQNPTTGAILFAMGHEGVLILQPGGESVSVAVGSYQPHPSSPNLEMLRVVLGDQGTLAGLAVLLVYACFAVPRLVLSKRWMRIVLWLIVGFSAASWLFVVMLFPPTITGYGYALVGLGILATALPLVFLTIALTVDLYRRMKARSLLWRMALVSLAGGVLFFIPSLFWAFNIIPVQSWIVVFSLVFVITVIAAGSWKLPHPPRPPALPSL